MSFENVKITTLDNGIRVVTDNVPGELVGTGIWNQVGSRYETADKSGLVHKIEHCVFRGTAMRTDRDIIHQIENGGGMFDAETCTEYSAYKVISLKKMAVQAFDILSDMFLHPIFPEKLLKVETKSIVNEIRMCEDDFGDLAGIVNQRLVFGDTPMGRSILGNVKSVKSITADDMHAFRNKYYSFDKTVICAFGAVDHDRIVEAASSIFAEPLCEKAKDFEPAWYIGGTAYKIRQSAQVTTLLSFNGVAQSDPDYYAAEALSIILGEGMASRLNEEIREKRGLAYDVGAVSYNFSDAGYVTLFSNASPHATKNKILPLMCREIHKAQDGFSDQEVERAKNQLQLRCLMRQESVADRIDKMGEDMLGFGRVKTFAETKAEIDAIDQEHLLVVAKRIFTSQPTYVAVGPVRGFPSYNKLCDWLKP